MSVNSGDKILLSHLDDLYSRLYNLTVAHQTSLHQQNSANIPNAQQKSNLSQGDTIATTTAKIDLLKQELKNLSNSWWYQSNTADTKVYMTDFSNNFSLPSVGELLQASDFNLIENTIATAETIIPNYENKYGTQYPSCYGTQYPSRYGTQYPGCYGTQYPSKYGTQYPSRYRTCYGTAYPSRYRTCYRTCYGTAYPSRYPGRYGTCYKTKAQIRC